MKTSLLPVQGAPKSAGRLALALVAAGLAGAGAAALPSPAAAEELPAVETPIMPHKGFADLVESVSPAVVSVRVEREERARAAFNLPHGFGLPEGHPMEKFFRRFHERHGRMHNDAMPRRRVMGQGSGFFISADGYLVTNHHVIKGGEDITVILHDGAEYDASLVGIDSKTDLALLRVETDAPTPYVAFAEEDNLRVGDWVVAVGNPFGLGGTVTSGIVSGRGRDIGAGPYDDFIQIDAPINRGNSGGPTFDLNGKVVGVNAMIFSPSGGNVGIGFAIPATTAQDVIDELMQDGAVSRGWLGVRVQPVDKDIAASLGLEEATGALVSEVVADSPAAAAGLRSGDIILAVDDEKIAKPRHLSRLIASLDADTQPQIRLWRDGEEHSLGVNLGELPREQQHAALTTGDADDTMGLSLEPSEHGMKVVAVDPDSDAARKRVAPGDVIVAVGAQKVASLEQLRERLQAARQSGRQSVLVLLRRGDSQHYVALPVPAA